MNEGFGGTRVKEDMVNFISSCITDGLASDNRARGNIMVGCEIRG